MISPLSQGSSGGQRGVGRGMHNMYEACFSVTVRMQKPCANTIRAYNACDHLCRPTRTRCTTIDIKCNGGVSKAIKCLLSIELKAKPLAPWLAKPPSLLQLQKGVLFCQLAEGLDIFGTEPSSLLRIEVQAMPVMSRVALIAHAIWKPSAVFHSLRTKVDPEAPSDSIHFEGTYDVKV